MNLFPGSQVISHPKDSRATRVFKNTDYVDGLLSGQTAFELSSTSVLLLAVSESLRTPCFHSPLVRFLHIVHTMHKYASLLSGALGGDLSSSCAGLSYIHGNQPVHSQRPVGLESNKTQTEPTMNQLLKCQGEGVRRARSNPRETVWDQQIRGAASSGTGFHLRDYLKSHVLPYAACRSECYSGVCE